MDPIKNPLAVAKSADDVTPLPKQKPIDSEKFKSFVVSEFERYEKFHSERFEKCRRYYDMWLGKPSATVPEHCNNIHVPLMVEGEQTITPRIFTALFPTDAPVDCQVVGETPAQAGILVKNLIQHYFRVSNVQGEAWSALTQNTLFGTAYVEGGTWLFRKGWVTDGANNRYYTIIESRPDCKFVDFFEIYPHPAKVRMEDGLPLIRRQIWDAEAIKSLAENPFFGFEGDLDKVLNSEMPSSSSQDKADYARKKGDEYEVLTYWGPYDEEYEKDGKLMVKKAVPYWGIVVNRQHVVKAKPNPYNHQMAPYCKIKLYEDAQPGWFGVGIGQIGQSTQERVNKQVSQRLDNIDVILNIMGVFDGNDTVLSRRDLEESRPGKWIPVSNVMTSLRAFEFPNVTSESYKEEELAKADFREAIGAVSSMMPTDNVGDQHRTAMGIQLLQGAAGMRLRPVLRNIELSLIQQLAMFFFSNAKQFMVSEEWVAIAGPGGEKIMTVITPEQIQAKVNFIPTGISETVNKETQIGQLLRFKELTINDPTINRTEINMRIAELMGFKDIGKLVIQAQPVQMAAPGADVLPPEMQLRIQQRLKEGATPDQIKMEMGGQKPVGGLTA